MVYSEIPNNWWDIIHSLVIRHENHGFVTWDIILIFHTEAGSQNIQAAHEAEIEDVHASFVRFISS